MAIPTLDKSNIRFVKKRKKWLVLFNVMDVFELVKWLHKVGKVKVRLAVQAWIFQTFLVTA